MNFDEDELLVRAIGDVGGLAGPRGRRGSETGARRLRKDVSEIDLDVDMSPQHAADQARLVIGELGNVLEPGLPDGDSADSATRIIGIVGSGVGSLNPAVVTVTVQPSERGSRLLIRGAAKEGLIKQKAGAKAARRVAAAMVTEEADRRPD